MVVTKVAYLVACGKTPHDPYTMDTLIRNAIMKVEGVVGCESLTSHRVVDSVDVDRVLQVQATTGKPVSEDAIKGKGARNGCKQVS